MAIGRCLVVGMAGIVAGYRSLILAYPASLTDRCDDGFASLGTDRKRRHCADRTALTRGMATEDASSTSHPVVVVEREGRRIEF